MGKKINPLIFRSKNKFKKLNWVGTKETYKKFLKEDHSIQEFIYAFFRKEKININSIYIFRKQTNIFTNKLVLYIVVYLSKIKSKKTFEETLYLKQLIQKKFFANKISIHIKILNTNNEHLVTEKFYSLINKIKQGGSMKLLMSNFLLSLKKINKILGAKIKILGRINGSEKARILRSDFGLINLQKIHSKIGYLTNTVPTKDGLINVIFIYNLR